MSCTIAWTPLTHWTASSAAACSAWLPTWPVRVATPFSTATPMWAALTLGSRSSASMMVWRSTLSSIIPLPFCISNLGLPIRGSLRLEHDTGTDLAQSCCRRLDAAVVRRSPLSASTPAIRRACETGTWSPKPREVWSRPKSTGSPGTLRPEAQRSRRPATLYREHPVRERIGPHGCRMPNEGREDDHDDPRSRPQRQLSQVVRDEPEGLVEDQDRRHDQDDAGRHGDDHALSPAAVTPSIHSRQTSWTARPYDVRLSPRAPPAAIVPGPTSDQRLAGQSERSHSDGLPSPAFRKQSSSTRFQHRGTPHRQSTLVSALAPVSRREGCQGIAGCGYRPKTECPPRHKTPHARTRARSGSPLGRAAV